MKGGRKRTPHKRTVVSKKILAATATIGLAGLLTYQTLFRNTAYTVTRVIDGDTFETAEKQRIRINGVQAPEAGVKSPPAHSNEKYSAKKSF